MSLNVPTKITVPFANSGSKNAIGVTAAVGDDANKANYTQGFPDITMTPKSAGGIPPKGRDLNGILFLLSHAIQYLQAGNMYKYDSSFASSISGYNKGAMLMQEDESGIWVSDSNGNTNNPETQSGWHPLGNGKVSISVAGSNVTLTRAQAAHPIIVVSGTLTNNVTVTLPAFEQSWIVLSSVTYGSYQLTFKTSGGSGVVISTEKTIIVCDGTDIVRADNAERGVPTGTIAPFGAVSAPDGWLRCNGATYSPTLYPELYSVIGTRYGGTTANPKLPNITANPFGITCIYCIKA